MSARAPNAAFPYSVYAALECSNYYSALYLIEQFVVRKNYVSAMPIFDREMFALIQVKIRFIYRPSSIVLNKQKTALF